MYAFPLKRLVRIALGTLAVCAIASGRASGQDGSAAPAPFPFALDTWYEFNVAGGDLAGYERFRFVDATRSDERVLYRLDSVLSLKRRDGAYREHETSLVFTAKGVPVKYRGKSDAYFPDSPGDTGTQTFLFEFLSFSGGFLFF